MVVFSFCLAPRRNSSDGFENAPAPSARHARRQWQSSSSSRGLLFPFAEKDDRLLPLALICYAMSLNIDRVSY